MKRSYRNLFQLDTNLWHPIDSRWDPSRDQVVLLYSTQNMYFVTNRDYLRHAAITLVAQPCLVNPLHVQIQACNYIKMKRLSFMLSSLLNNVICLSTKFTTKLTTKGNYVKKLSSVNCWSGWINNHFRYGKCNANLWHETDHDHSCLEMHTCLE